MSRPAFMFYVGDWRRNLKLRMCSHAARGAWMDVLCLMHDSDEYGVLRSSMRKIAGAAGCRYSLTQELAENRVIKGDDKHLAEAYIFVPTHARRKGAPVALVPEQDGPIWFSSRMVRDEYVRRHAGENTRFSHDDPSPCRRDGEDQGEAPTASPTARQGDGPSVAVAFAVNNLRLSERGGPEGKTAEGQTPVDKSTNGKKREDRWYRDDEGIVAKGREVGLAPKIGESMPDYKERLMQAIHSH